MILNLFITIDESFRYGEENSKTIARFTTEALRDKYFNEVLRVNYADLDEYEPNHFQAGKWCYKLSKDTEQLIIHEESY